MRIAMIGQKGIPAIYGGVERHVEDLSRELVKQGHEVFVYARAWYSPLALKNYHGVKVVHTPSIHTKHLDAISHTFFSTIHAIVQNYDVIHYHGVGPALLSFIPRIFSKAKVIVTFHCIDRYHQKWGWFAKRMLWLGEKAACTFPHQTIAVSKTIQSYCLNEYHTKTDYIPNGVVATKKLNGNNLNKWNLEPNKYVLMVSRLVRHKGVHYLIDAWQMAKSKNPSLFADQKLVIVGGSTFTDDYQKELKKMARVDKSIIFTGWLHGTELEEIYNNCGLYINPSENEGMPISVLQAMTYGKAVLLSDIPEHQELVTDTNFLFRNASIISLSEKITNLLRDEAVRKEAGMKNKMLMKKSFNWEKLSLQTLAIYSTIQKLKIPRFKSANA